MIQRKLSIKDDKDSINNKSPQKNLSKFKEKALDFLEKLKEKFTYKSLKIFSFNFFCLIFSLINLSLFLTIDENYFNSKDTKLNSLKNFKILNETINNFKTFEKDLKNIYTINPKNSKDVFNFNIFYTQKSQANYFNNLILLEELLNSNLLKNIFDQNSNKINNIKILAIIIFSINLISFGISLGIKFYTNKNLKTLITIISLISGFNNFINFEIFKSFFIEKNFILLSNYFIPSVKFFLILFYLDQIKKNFWLNLIPFFFANLLIFLFSIGFEWLENFSFFYLLFSFIPYSLLFFIFNKRRKEKKNLIKKNDEEIFKKNNFVENLNNGLIIFNKDFSFYLNKKFIEILQIKNNFKLKNFNKFFEQYSLFISINEFNIDLDKDILELLEFYKNIFKEFDSDIKNFNNSENFLDFFNKIKSTLSSNEFNKEKEKENYLKEVTDNKNNSEINININNNNNNKNNEKNNPQVYNKQENNKFPLEKSSRQIIFEEENKNKNNESITQKIEYLLEKKLQEFINLLFKKIKNNKYLLIGSGNSINPEPIKNINIYRNQEIQFQIYAKNNEISNTIEFHIYDITSLIQSEDLKAQNKYKKMFLNKFSHEFRNPILNISQLIKNIKSNIPCLNENLKAEIKHIKGICNYMSLLISDFDFVANCNLNFIKKDISEFKNKHEKKTSRNNLQILNFADSKKANENLVENIKFDLNKLISNLIQIFHSKISLSEKSIRISYHINKQIPVKIFHDQHKIKQILFNLLSNSFKFTINGSIHLDVNFEDNFLIFIVKDTGKGVKQKYLKELGRPFFRSESFNNNFGIGMGLHIIQKNIKIFKGEFIIESDFGYGTTITVKIPIDINDTFNIAQEKSFFDKYEQEIKQINKNNFLMRLKSLHTGSESLVPLKHKYQLNLENLRNVNCEEIKEKEIEELSNKNNNTTFFKKRKGFKSSVEIPNIENEVINDEEDIRFKNTMTIMDKKITKKFSFEKIDTQKEQIEEEKKINSHRLSNNNLNLRRNSKGFEEKLNNSKNYSLNIEEVKSLQFNSEEEIDSNFISVKNVKNNSNSSGFKENKNSLNASEISFKEKEITFKEIEKKYKLESPVSVSNIEEKNKKDEFILVKSNKNNFPAKKKNKNLEVKNESENFDNKSIKSIIFKSISKKENKNSNESYLYNKQKMRMKFIKNKTGNLNFLSNEYLGKLSPIKEISNFELVNLNFNESKSEKIEEIQGDSVIRILLVDDEKLIRQSEINVVKKFFKKNKKNFEIEECTDGVECLYKLYQGVNQGKKYDMIFTDETMNFMKGSTMCKIIRNLINDNILYNLSIYMVTSYESSTIPDVTKELIDKIFTKPLTISMLDNIPGLNI